MVTIPDGYGQVTAAFSGANIVGEAVWTQGFQNTDDDDAQGIADNFKSALLATDYMDQISSTITLDEVRVKLGPNETGPSAVSLVGNSGTIGGQPVSPQVALLVRKTTPLGGRRGRGRLYIPGMPAAALDDSGNFDAASANGVASDLQDMWSAMALVGQPPVLLHSGALTPTPLTAFVGQTRVATQRRRNRR